MGITGEVDYFEGQIRGSLTNQFPYPIENVTLVLYGNMVQLGHMESGETKNLSDHELLRYPLGDSYLAAEHISGEDAYASADIRNRSYMLAVERSNLTRFYLDNYLNGYTADARVIAFSTQKEESQFLKNPSEETYGITMLTQTIPGQCFQKPFYLPFRAHEETKGNGRQLRCGDQLYERCRTADAGVSVWNRHRGGEPDI